MQLTKDNIKAIAHLARLRVSDEDILRLRDDLSRILDWVEQLNEINVDNVEPLSGVNVESMPMYQDTVSAGGVNDEILQNAPEKLHDMFVVPKVVE